jgi:hypothetical protein
VLAALGLTLCACSASGSSSRSAGRPSSSTGATSATVPRLSAFPTLGPDRCPTVEAHLTLQWLAALPSLPRGTEVVKELLPPPGAGVTAKDQFHSALVVAPVDLQAFVDHTRTQWPAEGWTLGRGEQESLDAEGGAIQGQTYVAFRATPCAHKHVEAVVTTARIPSAPTSSTDPDQTHQP